MTQCEHLLPCIYASIWIGLIWIIIIPFEIYATINLYRYRRHPAIIKRYPTVVIGSAIFAMIHSFICEQFYYLESGINLDILQTNSALYIAHIIFPPFLLINVVIVVYRVYLIYFDINYAVSMSTRDWQSLLSDTVNNSDWYSRNHTTFGNWKYVSKYFIFYIIIGSTFDIFVTICEHPKLLSIPHYLSRLIYVFWVFILIIFGAYLSVKTPKFEDVYFVRKEMKYILNLCLFCLSLYVAMIIFASDTPLGRLVHQTQTSAMTIANFGLVVISEYIVLKKIMDFDKSAYIASPPDQTSSFARLRTFSSYKKSVPSPPPQTLFNVLIASPVGINFFVKHLRSEFAMENLLCFIEIIQWIYLLTNKDFNKFNIKPLEKIEFELSSAIPLSSANNQFDENNNEWDWKQSIILIFKKYMHSSAEYQVNLPYDVQNGFMNLINLLTIQQEIINNTYIFKNKPHLSCSGKRSMRLFWDKKSNKSKKCSPLETNMLTITENKAINHHTLNSPNIDAASSVITPLSPINRTEITPIPNTKVVTFEMESFPDHRLILAHKPSSMEEVTKKKFQKTFNQENRSNRSSSSLKATNNYNNKAISSIPYIVQENKQENAECVTLDDVLQRTSTMRSDTTNNDDISSQNGLVFIDDDGKEYKDPEISNTEKILNDLFVEEMCKDSIITDGEDKNSVIIPSSPFQPTQIKIENSVVYSVKQSFKKLTVFIGGGSNDSNVAGKNGLISPNNTAANDNDGSDGKSSNSARDRKLNELYAKELEQYENAKNLNLNQFLSIVCQSLLIILQLNYQSISRFKRSEQYIKLLETVNLDNLIQKHGHKGCQ